MKTTIVMNECVISSELTMEQLKKVEKFQPKKLEVIDPETKGIMFKVATGERGSVGVYGITFNAETAEGKKAAVKIPVCGESVAEKKAYIAENYGAALALLKAMEEGLATACKEIEDELKEIAEGISVTI